MQAFIIIILIVIIIGFVGTLAAFPLAFAGRRLTRRTWRAKVYVVNTKLTLRLDDVLVERAKAEATERGKSVSQMFAEFIASLGPSKRERALPPVTESLLGIMKGHRLSENDYRKHLREKYS